VCVCLCMCVGVWVWVWVCVGGCVCVFVRVCERADAWVCPQAMRVASWRERGPQGPKAATKAPPPPVAPLAHALQHLFPCCTCTGSSGAL